MRKQEIKSAIATALCVTLVAGSLNLSGGLNFKAKADESETVTYEDNHNYIIISAEDECDPEQFVINSYDLSYTNNCYIFSDDLFALADYNPASYEIDIVSNACYIQAGFYVVDSDDSWNLQNYDELFKNSECNMRKSTYKQSFTGESYGLVIQPWWVGPTYDEEENSHVSLTYMTEFRLLDEEGNVIVRKTLSDFEFVENNIELSYSENEQESMDYTFGNQLILSPVIKADDESLLSYEWTLTSEGIVNGREEEICTIVGNEPQITIDGIKYGQYTLRAFDNYGNSAEIEYSVSCQNSPSGPYIWASDADEFITNWGNEGPCFFKTAFAGDDIYLSPSVTSDESEIVKYEWYEADEYSLYYDGYSHYNPGYSTWTLLGSQSTFTIKNWTGNNDNPAYGMYKLIAYDKNGKYNSILYFLGPYYIDDVWQSRVSGTVGENTIIKLCDIVDKQNLLYYLWYGDFYADENGNYEYMPDDITYTEKPERDVVIGYSPEISDSTYIASPEFAVPEYAHRCEIHDSSSSGAVHLTPLTINAYEASDDGIIDDYSGHEITEQPEDISTFKDKTVQFHVAAEGYAIENAYYQWEVATSEAAYLAGEFNRSSLKGNKTDTLTVKATEARNGYRFRCIIYGDGFYLESYAAKLDVNPIPLHGITAYSDGVEIKESDNPVASTFIYDYNTGYYGAWIDVLSDRNISLKVNAEGNNLSYQWYVSKDGGEKWDKSGLSGNKTDTLKFKSDMSRYGYFFKCVISDSDGNVRESGSCGIRIDFLGVMCKDYELNVKNGETVTLSFGDSFGLELSYQWECSKDGGKTWVNSSLKGNKTPELTVTGTPSRDGYMYRYKLTNGSGKIAYSSVVTLHVDPITVTKQPKVTRKLEGETAVFSVEALGDDLTYQWQASKDFGKTWTNSALKGNKTNELTVSATLGRSGYLYRCILTDKHGNKKSSNGVVFYVSEKLITTQPAAKSVSEGTTAKFTVKAKAGSSYQWQVSTDNGKTWKNSGMTGNKTATLKVSATTARNGYMFRCVVKNNNFTETSKAVKLTVK